MNKKTHHIQQKNRSPGSFAENNKQNSFFAPVTNVRKKLKINQSNDRFEQEADTVADQVMSMSMQGRNNKKDFFTYNPVPIQRKCADCEKEEEELFRKEKSETNPNASNDLEKFIPTLDGKGKPMSAKERAFFEPRFNQDFSSVRLHTEPKAAKTAEEINALAYTSGNHIIFNQGKYQPETGYGKRLMAHELTHVIQGPKFIQRDPEEDAKNKEQEKIAKLKSEIKKAFSLKSVDDGSSNWTSEELRITKEAIEKIPKEDIPALKDVVLKRVSSLGGKTAGQFSSQQSVEDTMVTNEYELSIADLNFKQGTPEEEQKRLVQHEVGHAIASLPSRQANLASHKATANLNTKVNKQNESVIPFNEANDEFNVAVGEFNDKVNEFNNESEPTLKKQLKGELDALRKVVEQKRTERAKKEKIFKADKAATKVAKTASESKENEAKKHGISQKDLDAIEQSASIAKSNHDSVFKQAMGRITVDMKSPEKAAQYLASIQDLSSEIEKFHSETKAREKSEGEVENSIAEVDKKTETRIKAFETLSKTDASNSLLTILPTVETEQEKFFHAAKANALAHKRSARVQKFVAFVESNNIHPISDYARENWPHKPEEFYAEAYSFWVSSKLNAVSPDLQKWFDGKKYK